MHFFLSIFLSFFLSFKRRVSLLNSTHFSKEYTSYLVIGWRWNGRRSNQTERVREIKVFCWLFRISSHWIQSADNQSLLSLATIFLTISWFLIISRLFLVSCLFKRLWQGGKDGREGNGRERKGYKTTTYMMMMIVVSDLLWQSSLALLLVAIGDDLSNRMD